MASLVTGICKLQLDGQPGLCDVVRRGLLLACHGHMQGRLSAAGCVAFDKAHSGRSSVVHGASIGVLAVAERIRIEELLAPNHTKRR